LSKIEIIFNSFASLNMPVQRLKVAILPLDLPFSGPVTHSGEILTTDYSHILKYTKKIKIFLNDTKMLEL
jgi:hypothetical protein